MARTRGFGPSTSRKAQCWNLYALLKDRHRRRTPLSYLLHIRREDRSAKGTTGRPLCNRAHGIGKTGQSTYRQNCAGPRGVEAIADMLATNASITSHGPASYGTLVALPPASHSTANSHWHVHSRAFSRRRLRLAANDATGGGGTVQCPSIDTRGRMRHLVRDALRANWATCGRTPAQATAPGFSGFLRSFGATRRR